MINLYTTFYKDKSPEREKELIHCAQKNIECKEIDKIFFFTENTEIPINDDSKIIKIPIKHRPTYNDYFKVIKDVSNKNDFNIISNSDIFFDNHLGLLKKIKLSKICFALTRWDIKSDGTNEFLNMDYSQDSWIFRGIPKKIRGDFGQGIPGCDNRIAYEIHKAGYKIFNPSLSIKSFHFHLSDFHNYIHITDDPNKISRPHLLIKPTVLKSNMIYFLKHILKKNDIIELY